MRNSLNKTFFHFRSIDTLRCLAVLSVIISHLNNKWLIGGHLGVDIFFVISGFVVFYSIDNKNLLNSKFGLIDFYKFRILRLMPAAWLSFILVFILSLFFTDYLIFKESLDALIYQIFFGSNFHFWGLSDYFSEDSKYSLVIHYWSLAVEEQFYLIFPILMIIFLRFKFPIISLLIFGFILSIIIASYGSIYRSGAAAFYLLPTRAWQFILGILGYYLYKNLSKNNFKGYSYLKEISLFFILIPLFLFDEINYPSPSIFTLIPCLGTIIYIISSELNDNYYLIEKKGFFITGAFLSYSSYLFHQPIIAIFNYHSLFENNFFYIICLISIFLCSYFCYQFVENNIKNFRNKISVKSVFIIFISINLIFLSLFSLSKKYISVESIHNQNESLFLMERENIKKYLKNSAYDRGNCFFNRNQSVNDYDLINCLRVNDDDPMVIIGDSEAAHLYPGLLNLNKKNTVLASKASCVPVKDVLNEISCQKFYEQVLNALNELKYESPQFWVSFNWDSLFRRYSEKRILSELGSFIDNLTNYGKVNLVLGMPDFKADPYRMVLSKKLLDKEKIILKSEAIKKQKFLTTKFENYENLKLISVRDYFCDEFDNCFFKDGEYLFYDKGHLSDYGSNFLMYKLSE